MRKPRNSSPGNSCIRPFFHAAAIAAICLPLTAPAQINTGSNGSDGRFAPTANTVIDMSDHPTGIYQYTSVNIPQNVTVTFIPNANNTPLIWLVQGAAVVNGIIHVGGMSTLSASGAAGGPGGWSGGVGYPSSTGGQGPGGGLPGENTPAQGASYSYGNSFLVPLLGGSGGGGSTGPSGTGGGGGGGAILLAASTTIALNGLLQAAGGSSTGANGYSGGGGSGGAVRLVASQITGTGAIDASGGKPYGGTGRIRLDTYDNEFSGQIYGQFTQGFQPVIAPAAGQVPQLAITTIAGTPVATPPTGVLSTPDAVISAQQANPIPVFVQCANVPPSSTITVTVKPVGGTPVTAVGHNDTGTLGSSTATVMITMPRGGGLIYATATN